MKTIQELFMEFGLMDPIDKYQQTQIEAKRLYKNFLEYQDTFKKQKETRFVMLYKDTLSDMAQLKTLNKILEHLLLGFQSICQNKEKEVSYGTLKKLANTFKDKQKQYINLFSEFKNNFAVLKNLIKYKDPKTR